MKKMSATEFWERIKPLFVRMPMATITMNVMDVIDIVNSIPSEEISEMHYHPAYWGSEYACKKCNPICWVNHQFADPERMNPCQTDDCPLRR